MTALLAFAHAFKTNENFEPHLLYFGTFIVDITIAESLLKVLVV